MKLQVVTTAIALALFGPTAVWARVIPGEGILWQAARTSDDSSATYESLFTHAASPGRKGPQEWSGLWRPILPRANLLDPDVIMGDDSGAGDDSAGEEGASEGSAPMSVSGPSSSSDAGESTAGAHPIQPSVPIDIEPVLKYMFQDAVDIFKQGGRFAVGRDETIMYVGFDIEAKIYAEANGLMHYNDYEYDLRDVHPQYLESQAHHYPDVLSAAIGRTASGDVKLMSPEKGIDGPAILTNIEWPELVRNGQATSVTWINPANTEEELVIWKASQGPIDFDVNVKIKDMAREAAAHPRCG